MLALACPVHGCRARLERLNATFLCPRGHSFDVARGGYLNLLQPQDRRSRKPGDSKAVVAARRRWLARGLTDPLLLALREEIDRFKLPAAPAVLEAGCGDGFFLVALSEGRDWKACGIDLSVPAIRQAARRKPDFLWLVANADRVLPFEDHSMDLVLSVFGRRNGPEFRRVLRTAGGMVIALPGEDDLIELREAAKGRGILIERGERTVAALDPFFALAERRACRHSARLDADGLRDALAMTYRGARRSERDRIVGRQELEVTISTELLLFRPR